MTLLAAVLSLTGWTPFSTLCVVNDSRINESSGLAASLAGPGVYYTHNDSGDSARFFRFDKNGQVTGVFQVQGTAVDWEDMDAAEVAGVRYLYLADVGDNQSVRPDVVVYRVAEPPYTQSSGVLPTDAYRFRYPDGAHDCEGVFVAPDGAVWFVTKERTRPAAMVYRGMPSAGSTVTLEFVGTLTIDTGGLGGKLVTGASLAHRSNAVLVRTYSGVRLYQAGPALHGWWERPSVLVGNPVEMQGEAVCFSLDDRAVLTTTEGSPMQVSISQRKVPQSGTPGG